MNKSLKSDLTVIALLVAGLSVLLYPFISNYIYQYKADKMMDKYVEEMSRTNKADTADELCEVRAYNRKLVGQTPPDTFSEREGIHNDKEYDGLLNRLGNGMMGVIRIPSIRVKLPIYHYTEKSVLEKGAGHLFGSSLPVGGKSTHTVITAHRGLPSAKMFTNLDLLKNGDLIYLYIEGKNLAYVVDQTKTVTPEDCSDLGIEKGKDQITLVTCTPYGENTRRLLVRGHRTKYPGRSTAAHHRIPVMRIFYGLAGASAAAVLVMIIYRIWDRKTRNRSEGREDHG